MGLPVAPNSDVLRLPRFECPGFKLRVPLASPWTSREEGDDRGFELRKFGESHPDRIGVRAAGE